MTGYKAFRYYVALKLHFSKDKFDVFQNRGNIKGSFEAFNARNDRYMFEKLARKYDTDQELIQFFVSNFAYGNTDMVYGMEQGEENYIVWKRRKESITHLFKSDLDSVQLEAEKNKLDMAGMFYFLDNNYPYLLKMYLGKQVSIETLHIINLEQDIIANWKMDSRSVMLEDELRRIEKLRGFVKYDREKIQKIFSEFKHSLMWDV
jgi:hypothetical protein